MKYSNILETVGNTPIISLKKFSKDLNTTIWAKLEYFNPAGSTKDRMAMQIISEAEKDGILKPGGTIVEASSGNTGIALAMIGAVKGYRVIIVAPDRISEEKINLLEAYGAKVIIVAGDVPHDSLDSYYSVAKKIAAENNGAYLPDQYRNSFNPQAHFITTGKEIWDQMDGNVDIVVIGIGTGGTVMGVCDYLKQQRSDIKIIGVDAEGSILSEESKVGKHLVEGLGIEFDTPIFNADILDDIILVKNKDAIRTCHKLAQEEGILVGASSGASAFAAAKITKEIPENSTIVAIFPDSGERYLSKYYNRRWLKTNLSMYI